MVHAFERVSLACFWQQVFSVHVVAAMRSRARNDRARHLSKSCPEKGPSCNLSHFNASLFPLADIVVIVPSSMCGLSV